MAKKKALGPWMAGAGAGAVNGLFGAGGGMILVPALTLLTETRQEDLFPTSVAVIAPICLVSLGVYALRDGLPLGLAWPYLIGSALGGLTAGLWGRKIPTRLLHKALGLMILWGGIRSFF